MPGGALITDLGSLQEYLARQSLPPLPVTQWWLATRRRRRPADALGALARRAFLGKAVLTIPPEA